MKLNSIFFCLPVAAIAAGLLFARQLPASEANSDGGRVGVYDSRAIAYAHFWSEGHQRELKDLVKSAKEARATGDTNRFAQLDAALRAENDRNHLQVFSTAAIDDLLVDMPERIAAIQNDTGVSILISKWDKQSLREHAHSERIDVTNLLLQDFQLTDKQRKTIEELRKKPPLPLDKARELLREGKL